MKHQRKNGFAIVGVFLVLALIVGLGGFFIYQNSKGYFTNTSQQKEAGFLSGLRASPTPTPFPFQEMTIPSLRSRQYESSLKEMQILSENSNYTSYLTSYDSDGLNVNGLLTIPSGNEPEAGWPAIVFVHGYIPPSEYKTTQNYVAYLDYIAKNGFVVFKIDLRGHDKSDGEAGGAYYSADYIIDTLNARAALQNAKFVNPEKIGLWGHSMAGNVTFRSFIAKQDIPALVIWAGAVYTYEDMQEFGISDNSYRPPPPDSERRKKRERLFNTYGAFDKDSDFWKQVIPTNYLAGVNGAIQINHALNDPVVGIDYSKNLMDILDNSNITHELNEYPSGGHNIAGESFTPAMQATVTFFKEHLK